MTEPYLIAHIVRGQPAFDIAERMDCPICEPIRQGLDDGSAPIGCDECDGLGFWWILSTCGYRATPYWSTRLIDVDDTFDLTFRDHTFWIDAERGIKGEMSGPPLPPVDWPDLFPINDKSHQPTTEASRPSLLARLGLLKPSEPIKRRI